ncbi:MAG: M24 family metallopeptidase [archaeon]
MINSHIQALEKLEIIMKKAFNYIKENIGKVSELDVERFILSEFKKQGLVSDKNCPIVAVNKNTSNVHYFLNKKTNKIIKKNDLILIDIWARLKKKGSVYADITWMGYAGKKASKKIEQTLKMVINGRDIGVDFIKKQLKKGKIPKGNEVDKIIRDFFKDNKLDEFFKHSTGHCLGKYHCHGKGFKLSRKYNKELKTNFPFTIEPGLYFKDDFGVRSEINCYIDTNKNLIVLGEVQKDMFRF